MKRDISSIQHFTYDVVIVGGGIFGACAVWEAALRGLKVVLIEKNDFSHATSANHFKMVHCGIRYLQHGDVARMRESSRERSSLLRIAPHLVHTVPIVIPTYGQGLKGKLFLGTGMTLYDLLTTDRNNGVIAQRKISKTRFIDSKEVLSLFPQLPDNGLTGAAIFEEGQMYNPPRLALAFIKSAAGKGADIANYTEAVGFVRKGDDIAGVMAKDLITGEIFNIKGKMVLNTAGPWAHRLLKNKLGISLKPSPTFSRDLAFVIPRYFDNPYGLAMLTQTKDADSIVDRGGRHLFAFPWRDFTLIGVWHKVFHQSSEKLTVTQEELENYRIEVESAYPGLCKDIDNIKVVNTGLTLFGDEDSQKRQQISFGKRSQIIDHERENGVRGLVTSIGVRATTARGMASKAMDLIFRKMKIDRKHSDSAFHPIWGGDFRDPDEIIKAIRKEKNLNIPEKTRMALFRNYGTGYADVLKYQRKEPRLEGVVPGSNVLKAEVVHAVREEMAIRLGDVIFRRTDLGTGGLPPKKALNICADLMADELGWSYEHKQSEIMKVTDVYPRLG